MAKTTLASRHIRLNHEEIVILALAMGYGESDDYTRLFLVDEDELFEEAVCLFAEFDEAIDNERGSTVPMNDGTEKTFTLEQTKSLHEQLGQALDQFDS